MTKHMELKNFYFFPGQLMGDVRHVLSLSLDLCRITAGTRQLDPVCMKKKRRD